jgi:acyl-homoserine lactone acylase PvdQ
MMSSGRSERRRTCSGWVHASILATFMLTGCDARESVDSAAGVPGLPGTGSDAGKTVVYRDTFGVPHIYAPTVEAGLYAQGWAQAQDRPEQLLMNLKLAMGEFSEVAGEDGVQMSLLATMFGHMRNAAASVAGMSETERARITAFANGISDFYAAHPDDVPEWWRYESVTAEMVDAFGRMFLYNWSIDEALGDLRRGGIDPDFVITQRGSNQWAVGPARTADGHAILLIDPHLSWWGPSRFWEMRIHAGELEGSGVGLAGSPYIGLGHNGNIGWAMTTGGPDTADVFALALDPQNPNRYRYDDGWRDIERHTVNLGFADGTRRDYVWESSHHGPIVARANGLAYAAKIAYDGSTNRNSAWEALNFAEDYRGAMAACETLSMFPQNVMVADTSGNIYYQRTGRVPVRPSGYDWSRPVDGSTSASEWQGIHPASDHLQVLNPESGYLQNCNIPPDAMIPDSPFSLDAQPDYLFSSADHGAVFDGWTNQRGARAIELLEADSDVTVEEALAYAVDVTPFGFQRWLEALRQSEPQASEALEELLTWDGKLTRESRPGLKYYYWRRALHEMEGGPAIRELVDDHYAIVEQRPPRVLALNDDQRRLIAQAWQTGLERMRQELGNTVEPWGRVFRVGRDDVSWPVGGGGGDHLGLTTLRSMGFAEADGNFERRGNRGQTSTQIVVLSKPIRSWGYLPVGQSDRPESAHYRDQAETVFSDRALKPSWWTPEELKDHIVSRVELKPRL